MNKIIILLGVSVLVVALGIFLILTAKQHDVQSGEVANGVGHSSQASFKESLEESRGLIITASERTGSGDINDAQGSSRLVRGSEEWCEFMMEKNNNQWSEADTQLFGLKCLN